MKRWFSSSMAVITAICIQGTTEGLAQVEPFTYRAPLEPFKIQQLPDLQIQARNRADLVLQRSIFTPGVGGWHTHPGPSFAIVLQGYVQLQKYSDRDGCSLTDVYGPGDVYIKPPNELHRAVVLGDEDEVELIVRFNIPEGGAIGVPLPADVPAPDCPNPLAAASGGLVSQALPARTAANPGTLENFLVQEVEAFTTRATLYPFKIHQLPDFLMHSTQPSDMVVQRLSFKYGPGGWHTHPGPSFVYVLDGAIKLQEYDPKKGVVTDKPVYTSNQAYFEEGNKVHRAVVLSEGGALLLVARFNVPVGGALNSSAKGPLDAPW